MMCIRLIVRFSYVLLVITAIWLNLITNVYADTWRGTAPFCDGECLPGEVQIGTSTSGDGGTCWTGHKVLCRNQELSCSAQQTKTSCYGVVLMCDNGYYEPFTNNWHSCNTYACGACLGFSSSRHPFPSSVR